jgi:hypothetical protein
LDSGSGLKNADGLESVERGPSVCRYIYANAKRVLDNLKKTLNQK